MRIRARWFRLALTQHAEKHPDAALALRAMAENFVNPGLVRRSMEQVAMRLLGLDDLPDETWHGPLPDASVGQDILAGRIDSLSAEWNKTTLHRLVALRHVAWAASQLARRYEKMLDDQTKTL